MGLLESLGVSNPLSGINWGALGVWATFAFLAFIILLVAGLATFFYYTRKIKKLQFRNQIPIFQTLHGKHTRITVDYAKEVFVPDTNVSLFFLRDKKIYIARPTRAMGKNEYWYSISENGEWVNFDLTADPEKSTLSQANYDHRDTRYAYINLKEIIKRNYKDKAVKWWKEYSHIITFIIVAFVFVGSMWVLISKIGNLIAELGVVADKFSIIADKMATGVQQAQNINSGVVGA